MAVCDAGLSGFEYLLEFEFIKAITCTYADAAGLAVTGMFVFGAIGLSIFIRTGSLLIPFGLVMLTGGAVMGVVAGPVVAIVTLIVLGAGAGVVTLAYREYSR